MSEKCIHYHGLTDVGIVRDHNEDAFGFFSAGSDCLGDGGTGQIGADVIAVLSDGVGGHEAGELASASTIAAVGALLGQLACAVDPHDIDQVRERIDTAMAGQNRHLRLLSKHQGQGTKNMAATLTAAWFAVGRVILVQAGDSRLYRWREGKLEQLSVDDTIAGRAIAEGRMSEKEGRADPNWHVLQRAMGIDEKKFAVTVASWEVQDGDVYLLSSDGLTDGMTNAQLEKGFARFDPGDLPAFNTRLIEAGNQASGKDNITVALLRVEEGWCAASQQTKNRQQEKGNSMKQGYGILTGVLGLAIILLFAGGIALWRGQQEQAKDAQAATSTQTEAAQALETRLLQLEGDLAELPEEQSKRDAAWELQLGEISKSLKTMDRRQQESLSKLDNLKTSLEVTRQKAFSASGQSAGLSALIDQHSDRLKALRGELDALKTVETVKEVPKIPVVSSPEALQAEAAVVAAEGEQPAEAVVPPELEVTPKDVVAPDPEVTDETEGTAAQGKSMDL